MTEPSQSANETTTNQLGKRYRCDACGVEILCLAAGQGTFTCHGVAMSVIQLTALPASD
jgi:hypothetical protein